ncbi:hypothetical protein [Streptomyces hygroscopicus]|uniref:hypothetical protein n=1 Tax=Streptomyces hygroscopicus TaxID=1912 RepID=UPI00367EDA79
MTAESVPTQVGTGGEAPSDDPYALRTSDIKEPPRDLRGTVRRLGPGMILSGAVVGSGELITKLRGEAPVNAVV